MEFVYLIAVIGLAIWAALWARRASPLANALVVLWGGSCLGYEFFHWEGTPIPVTIDRILWLALVGQVAWLWCGGHVQPFRPRLTDLAMLAWIGVVGVSAITHDWRAHGNHAAGLYLFFYFMPFGMYVVGRTLRWSGHDERTLIICMAAFGSYLAVTALAENARLWWMVWPSYIHASSVTAFFGRARGPFLNPVANGMVMTIGWIAGLLLWPRSSRPVQLGLVAWSVLMAAGIYGTYTRSVWLAAGLSLAVFFWLNLPRAWRPVLVTCGLLAVLVAVAAWEDIKSFKRDDSLTAAQTEESVQLRPILARVAWNMFLDRPLAGCGFGHYFEEKTDYLFDQSSDLPLSKAKWYVQHNVFLSLLTETGLAGLIPLLVLLAMAARDALRCRPPRGDVSGDGAVAWLTGIALLNYAVNGMFHDVSVIAMVHMLTFFLMGLAANLANQGEESATPALAAWPRLSRKFSST